MEKVDRRSIKMIKDRLTYVEILCKLENNRKTLERPFNLKDCIISAQSLVGMLENVDTASHGES